MCFPDVDAVLKTPYSRSEPFELVFLEEILREICDTWNTRTNFFNGLTANTMEIKVDYVVDGGAIIHRLALLNESLSAFEIDITQALECLSHLLSNEDDMLGLLLTETAAAETKKTHVDPTKHEIAELLLEDYSRQLSTLLQQINFLKSRVKGQQELMSLSIDGYRNLIIQMELAMTVVNVALATTTSIAGMFGMNLLSGYEHHPTAFYFVAGGSTLSCMIVCAFSLHYIRGKRWKGEATKRRELADLEDALSDVCAVRYVRSLISLI